MLLDRSMNYKALLNEHLEEYVVTLYRNSMFKTLTKLQNDRIHDFFFVVKGSGDDLIGFVL